VAARFGALHDKEVAARALGGDRLVERSDLPAHQRASGMTGVDELRVGLAVVELDDPRPARRHRDARGIEERHQEVHADGAARPLRSYVHARAAFE
jgi:hypothetical protein